MPHAFQCDAKCKESWFSVEGGTGAGAVREAELKGAGSGEASPGGEATIDSLVQQTSLSARRALIEIHGTQVEGSRDHIVRVGFQNTQALN
jgi:hypothetical protein